jgi:hypothetical protein
MADERSVCQGLRCVAVAAPAAVPRRRATAGDDEE